MFGLLSSVFLSAAVTVVTAPQVNSGEFVDKGVVWLAGVVSSALRVTVPADASVRITSEAMPLKPGATYAVSAWMRADTPGRTSFGLAGPLPSDWWNGSTKGFAVSTNWMRFGGSITVPPNHHEAVFSVSWAKPGAIWLDEVMVRETTADESPASAVFAPRAAVEAGPEAGHRSGGGGRTGLEPLRQTAPDGGCAGDDSGGARDSDAA